MDQQAYPPPTAVARNRTLQYAVVALALLAMAAIFHRTFPYLYGVWHQEEYSHGFLVPFISAFLLWQRRGRIAQVGIRPSWAGVAIVAVGVAIHLFGMLASITT